MGSGAPPDEPGTAPAPARETSPRTGSVLGFLRAQAEAWASMPISAARLLAALADAAEASVGVLQQLDERASATNRVLHSFEDPLVRLAEAVDASLVDSTVDALGRLPAVLARAAALTERADGVLSGLEAPVRALGPLAQTLDAGRLGGLVERLEETIPGIVRLPDTESEVRRLRERLDRMYRVVDDVQGRLGGLPGAGLLMRRGQGDVARGLTASHGGTNADDGGVVVGDAEDAEDADESRGNRDEG